jgi:carbonic anhydrase/acetyltransferase-like protein (isoleucine patch superfamily)
MTTAERLETFLKRKPQIEKAGFVAGDAKILGDVKLGRNASVFYGAVLRADINSITVGEGTNVQDGCIIHLADDLGAHIGDFCTIGHGAIIHACTIGNECLIGMRAVILDGAVIGDQCLIAAGSVVTPRTNIPPRSMVMGMPAKVVRQLKDEEIALLRQSADKYIEVAQAHAAQQNRLSDSF